MAEPDPEQLHIGPTPAIRALVAGDSGAPPDGWQVRPTTFLESIGTRMMLGLLVTIMAATVALMVFWVANRPDAAHLLADLRQFPTSQPSALKPEDVVELLAKRQAAYDESYRGTFQLRVMSGLVPLFTLMAGYVFGKSKA